MAPFLALRAGSTVLEGGSSRGLTHLQWRPGGEPVSSLAGGMQQRDGKRGNAARQGAARHSWERGDSRRAPTARSLSPHLPAREARAVREDSQRRRGRAGELRYIGMSACSPRPCATRSGPRPVGPHNTGARVAEPPMSTGAPGRG